MSRVRARTQGPRSPAARSATQDRALAALAARLGRSHPVGLAGHAISIDPGWRVLDVGSGHRPFERADVLLERFLNEDAERSGVPVDRSDPRLVEGDALHMPFADGEFDYVVASHVAEHVDDPEQLCRELSRVARAGYLETPGWLGDILMREPFHRWRVRRRGRRLVFSEVVNPRPLGRIGEGVYALCYIGEARPGHRSITSSQPLLRRLFRLARYVIARLWRSALLRDRMYLCHEWEGSIEVEVLRMDQRPKRQADGTRGG